MRSSIAKKPRRSSTKAARVVLETRFSATEAEEIVAETVHRYRELACDLPREKTLGARLSLRWAAFDAALFRTLIERGTAKEEALELAGEATWEAQRRATAPLNRIAAFLARDPLKAAALAAKLSRRSIYRSPGWIMQDVTVADGFGFDITRCPFSDYLRPLGLGELCERAICDTDVRAAEARGVAFTRAGTLAGGSRRCDFRFSRKP
jgi:hypothetical protein